MAKKASKQPAERSGQPSPHAGPSPHAAPPAVRPAVRPMEWKRHLICIAGLCAVALAAYSNSFRSDFVYDNRAMILEDPRVHAATSGNLQLIWSQGYWYPVARQNLYRPLVTLSYLFNYSVLGNGANPAAYHWINFSLHAANMLLVYALGLAIFAERRLSVALAALWGVHPVLTESVTNIVGRADLLAGFGILAGLLCHIRAAEAIGSHRIQWLLGISVAAVVGIFSKENAVALLAVMAVYDLAFAKRPWKELISGYFAVAAPFAIYFYQRAQVLGSLPATPVWPTDNPLVAAGFWTARLTAVQVIGRYLGLLAWPQSLSCDYSFSQISLFRGTFQNAADWVTVLALISCLGAVAAGMFCYRRCRPVCFFVLFFFVTLAPTANVFLLIGTIMAERLLYLPALAWTGCLVWAVHAACRRIPLRNPVWVLAPVCLLLMCRTYVRNFDWRDGRALWTTAVIAAPDSYMTHLSLAIELGRGAESDLDRAIAEGERAIAILSTLPVEQRIAHPYASIGSLARLKGSLAAKGGGQAGPWYEKARAILSSGAEADRAVAAAAQSAARSQGKPEKPYGWYPLYLELGQTELLLSRPREALAALEYGRRIQPVPEFFEHISRAHRALEQPDESAIALMEGVILYPEERAFPSELMELYRQTAGQSCAVNTSGGGTGLNLGCPLVHNHLCTASRNVMRLQQERGDAAAAGVTRQVAIDSMGCPAGDLR